MEAPFPSKDANRDNKMFSLNVKFVVSQTAGMRKTSNRKGGVDGASDANHEYINYFIQLPLLLLTQLSELVNIVGVKLPFHVP